MTDTDKQITNDYKPIIKSRKFSILMCSHYSCSRNNLCSNCNSLLGRVKDSLGISPDPGVFKLLKDAIQSDYSISQVVSNEVGRFLLEKLYLNYINTEDVYKVACWSPRYKGLPPSNVLSSDLDRYYDLAACILCEHIAIDPLVCAFCNGFYCAACIDFILETSVRMNVKLSNYLTNICIKPNCILEYLLSGTQEHVFVKLNETDHSTLHSEYIQDAKFICRRSRCGAEISPVSFSEHETACRKGVLLDTIQFYEYGKKWIRGEQYDSFMEYGSFIAYLPVHIKRALKKRKQRSLCSTLLATTACSPSSQSTPTTKMSTISTNPDASTMNSASSACTLAASVSSSSVSSSVEAQMIEQRKIITFLVNIVDGKNDDQSQMTAPETCPSKQQEKSFDWIV